MELNEIIIDLILAGIMIVMTAVYAKKGFAKTILKFVSFFLSIVLSRVLSGTVTDWVFSNTKLFAGMERYIAKLMITVITFVVLSVLLTVAVSLINKIFKIPVLKQANQILGGLIGAICGGIIVVILCFVLQISSHVVYNAEYVNAVENSKIVQLVLSDEKVSEGINALK
jgi:uncharacterized membrane protein required for colicin V production